MGISPHFPSPSFSCKFLHGEPFSAVFEWVSCGDQCPGFPVFHGLVVSPASSKVQSSRPSAKAFDGFCTLVRARLGPLGVDWGHLSVIGSSHRHLQTLAAPFACGCTEVPMCGALTRSIRRTDTEDLHSNDKKPPYSVCWRCFFQRDVAFSITQVPHPLLSRNT